MKFYISLFICMLSWTIATAQDYKRTLPAIQHLKTVNKEWNAKEEFASKELTFFSSDAERIQFHLKSVVQVLENDNANYHSPKLEKRQALIDTLAHYAAKGQFPQNTFHTNRTPYFIDIYSTYCAVGYLIKASGNDDLAKRISTEHNYDYIRDIKTAGVAEWATEHGFTIDELALIQPGYLDRRPMKNYSGGVNGPVQKVIRHWFEPEGEVLIVMGEFDSVGDIACNGAAFYLDNKWQCLGDGIEGRAYAHYRGYLAGDSIYFLGDFIHEGNQYPIAIYSKSQGWEFPEKISNKHLIATSYIELYESYVITFYLPDENITEVWIDNENGGMELLLTANGIINDADFHPHPDYRFSDWLVFAGAFDKVKLARDNEWRECYNLFVIKETYGLTAQGLDVHMFEERFQDTILTVQSFGRNTYLGGTCIDTNTYKGVCLAKLTGVEVSTALTTENFYMKDNTCPCQISDMTISYTLGLLMVGDFTAGDGTYEGRGIGIYDALGGYALPYGYVMGELNSIALLRDEIVFGGDFKNNGQREVLNNIAGYGSSTSQPEVNGARAQISVFPNPVSELLHVKSKGALIETLELVNLQGQRLGLYKDLETLQHTISVSDLTPGIYLLKTTDSRGQQNIERVVVF